MLYVSFLIALLVYILYPARFSSVQIEEYGICDVSLDFFKACFSYKLQFVYHDAVKLCIISQDLSVF